MAHDDKRRSRFPETRWSLVGRAADADAATRQRALGDLLVAYLPALRGFLVAARRLPTDLADDLLQAFVADKVLAAGLVGRADPRRGKFRNFVLKSLNNFVSTKLQREYSARAAARGVDLAEVTSPDHTRAADCFDQEWVRQVVRDALERMEAACRAAGRTDEWEIFRLRVVEPMLHEAEPADYESLVARLRVGTPRQAMNLLATGKRSFLRHLRDAVGQYVTGEAQIEQELADLREIVAR